MKNQDNDKKTTKSTKTTAEKSKITSDMKEIGFDDKRTETTKVVKKTETKSPKKTEVKKESVTKKVAPKTEAPKSKREIRAEKAFQRKLDREEKRGDKQKMRAEKRIAKAKEKEARKELKKDRVAYVKAKEEEKAERAKLRAEKSAKRKENFNAKKEQFSSKMEDRKERRAERKEERHEERLRRKSMTREEKREEKFSKREEARAVRARRKAERAHDKAEKARAIAELKSRGIKVGTSKGLVAAVIAVSIVGGVAVLSSVALAGTNMMYMREIDRTYMQSYYDVMQSANNLSVDLAKSSVSNGTSGLASTFAKASTDAFMAEKSLENIPSKDHESSKLIKFFNQAGEFTKMIADKAVKGEKLTEEEQELLKGVSKTASEIKEQINKAYTSSKHGQHKMHAVSNMFKGEILSDISMGISKLSQSTIEYPTMIYDGPFSDSENVTVNKDREKTEISLNEAKAILQDKLQVEKVDFVTETNSKSIGTYDFKFEKMGVEVYAQVDKACGTIVMIDANKRVAESKISEDTALAKAKEYLKTAGFEDVVKVWAETSGNITTFNFAKFQNGAVIYPQLVKVKVALSDGAVLGAEGYSYVKNYKERNEKPSISLADARGKISEKINVQTEKLVVIPLGNSEKLCYEFMGDVDGQTYFVYIDAKTGNQADIMMVVENPAEGSQII